MGGAPQRSKLIATSRVAVPFVVAGVTWALAVVDNDKRTLGLYSPMKDVEPERLVTKDAQPLVQFLNQQQVKYDLRPIDGPQLASGSDAGVLVLAYLEALLRGAERPDFPGTVAPLLRARIAAELLTAAA